MGQLRPQIWESLVKVFKEDDNQNRGIEMEKEKNMSADGAATASSRGIPCQIY